MCAVLAGPTRLPIPPRGWYRSLRKGYQPDDLPQWQPDRSGGDGRGGEAHQRRLDRQNQRIGDQQGKRRLVEMVQKDWQGGDLRGDGEQEVLPHPISNPPQVSFRNVAGGKGLERFLEGVGEPDQSKRGKEGELKPHIPEGHGVEQAA